MSLLGGNDTQNREETVLVVLAGDQGHEVAVGEDGEKS